MGVITNLLPGLRELRAPLAAGYMWLAVLALIFRKQLSISPDQGSLLFDLYRLSEWLGTVGSLAVVAFVAYLLGILSVAVSSFLLARLSRKHRRSSRDRDDLGSTGTALSPKGLGYVRSVVQGLVQEGLRNDQVRVRTLNTHPEATALLEAITSNLEPGESRRILTESIMMEGHFRAMIQDLELIPARLMGGKSDLYSAHDRLMAEGEFRAAISLPCVALGLALIATTDAWWFVVLPLALILTGALMSEARSRVVAGFDQLAEVLRANDGADSPAAAAVRTAPIQFKKTHLTPDDLSLLHTRAAAAEAQNQPQRAIEWYAILADAGLADAHEKLCDLTRTVSSADTNGFHTLQPRLIAGGAHSGRLALEAVDSIVRNGTDEDWANQGLALGLSMLNILRSGEHSRFGFQLIGAVYVLDSLDEPDAEQLLADLHRVRAGTLAPTAFLVEHPIPDLTREGMRAIQQDVRNGIGYNPEPSWVTSPVP